MNEQKHSSKFYRKTVVKTTKNGDTPEPRIEKTVKKERKETAEYS